MDGVVTAEKALIAMTSNDRTRMTMVRMTTKTFVWYEFEMPRNSSHESFHEPSSHSLMARPDTKQHARQRLLTQARYKSSERLKGRARASSAK
eukprot:2053550-Rhodomonas_salina.2